MKTQTSLIIIQKKKTKKNQNQFFFLIIDVQVNKIQQHVYYVEISCFNIIPLNRLHPKQFPLTQIDTLNEKKNPSSNTSKTTKIAGIDLMFIESKQF